MLLMFHAFRLVEGLMKVRELGCGVDTDRLGGEWS